MKHGFSLVELSIVLVILGLLTGGILAGQSLIKAAELRKLSTQLNSMRTAMFTFRDKYFALPGDMTNAFSFWGTTAACTNTSVLAAPYDGCNGNGDGIIHDNTTTLGGEDLRAVQFMALAGLIEGSYTGLPASSGNVRQVGVNIIRGPYKNAALWINDLSTVQFSTYSGNNIYVGLEGATTPSAGVLNPEELWNIDTKMDDGKASTGVITTMDASASCYAGSDYALSASTAACQLVHWLR